MTGDGAEHGNFTELGSLLGQRPSVSGSSNETYKTAPFRRRPERRRQREAPIEARDTDR